MLEDLTLLAESQFLNPKTYSHWRSPSLASGIMVVESRSLDDVLVCTRSAVEAGWVALVCPPHRLAAIHASLGAAGYESSPDILDHTGVSAFESSHEGIGYPAGAGLCFATSGTTGLPKLVPFDCDQVKFLVDALSAAIGYRSGDVILSPMPLGFDYGFYQMLLCGRAGAKLEVAPVLPYPLDFVSSARRLEATVLPLTPALARRLANAMIASGALLPTVRLVTSTGADFSPRLIDSLRKVLPNATILPMYGMTECKRISISSTELSLRSPASCGIPLAGTTVEIDPLEPAATMGEIVVHGPHVTNAYVGSMSGLGGTLRTGDLGRLGDAGEIYHAGRIGTDFVKFNDERIGVVELERAVSDAAGQRLVRVRFSETGTDSRQHFYIDHEGVIDAPLRTQALGAVEEQFGRHVARACRFNQVEQIAVNENGKVVRQG